MNALRFFVFVSTVILLLGGCAQLSSSDIQPAKIGGQRGSCVCAQYYEPVCGADGKTYGNTCEAQCAGVASQPGECIK